MHSEMIIVAWPPVRRVHLDRCQGFCMGTKSRDAGHRRVQRALWGIGADMSVGGAESEAVNTVILARSLGTRESSTLLSNPGRGPSALARIELTLERAN
jgi:hypothetical protein